MEEYLIPTAFGQAEFVEKKSRFIGHIWPTETEAEAISHIEQMRKLHFDATHNVWAYVIQNGPVRFSDDGEPGGTAGMPTLQVLQKEGLFNVTCVVTRYFGGILLGAGGLVRAYTKGAKLAVDAAGKSIKRVWTCLYLPVPYSWYDRMKLEVARLRRLDPRHPIRSRRGAGSPPAPGEDRPVFGPPAGYVGRHLGSPCHRRGVPGLSPGGRLRYALKFS